MVHSKLINTASPVMPGPLTARPSAGLLTSQYRVNDWDRVPHGGLLAGLLWCESLLIRNWPID